MTHPNRPLSPHLQVYRWQITMLTSILHRATGIILAVADWRWIFAMTAPLGLASLLLGSFANTTADPPPISWTPS